MPLAFEVDALDGVDDAHKPLYKQTEGGKFRLDVDGVDGILKKNTELLTETKAERAKRQALEQQLAQQAEQDLVANKKFEELAEQRGKDAATYKARLEQLEQNIANEKRTSVATTLAAAVAVDESAVELLAEQVLKMAEYTPEGVKFKDGLTAEQVKAHLTSKYPRLVKGSGASGGGASGANGGAGEAKTMLRSEFDKMTPDAKHRFMRSGGSLTE
jgi:hypothetical protein